MLNPILPVNEDRMTYCQKERCIAFNTLLIWGVYCVLHAQWNFERPNLGIKEIDKEKITISASITKTDWLVVVKDCLIFLSLLTKLIKTSEEAPALLGNIPQHSGEDQAIKDYCNDNNEGSDEYLSLAQLWVSWSIMDTGGNGRAGLWWEERSVDQNASKKFWEQIQTTRDFLSP